MKHLKYIAAVAGVLAVSMINSQAITYSAAANGTTAPLGVTFTPTGGALGLKSEGPTTILGVTGGVSGNEISPGQKLTVSFDTPQYIVSLSLGLLYNGPEYGDFNEIAGILVNDAGSTPFTLTVVGDTVALWTGSGTVTNLSPAVNSLGGEWKISNPFGYTLVSALYLYPIANPGQTKSPSEFGLSAFVTPDSGSMATMLGLSLLAIGVTSHMVRRRTA
jgi:hypothetical protein